MADVREVERRSLFSGFLRVDEVSVQVGDQAPVTRQVIERGDASAVLIYRTDRQTFLLVRQLRVPTVRHGEPFLTEIVAGIIDPGETPEQAARREVEEEVGFRPTRLEFVAPMFGSPGGLSEKVWIYVAHVDAAHRVSEGGGIEDEELEMVELPYEEAYRQLDAGAFSDAKTQIALHIFRSRALHRAN